jgi:hypothetical protein
MRRFALVLFVMALALGLALPAAAQEALPDFIQHTACEVDLSGETVTVFHFGDISGSYAFITQPLLAGLAHASEYFNARGGICGATIASENRDTGGDLAQVQASYDDFSSRADKPDVLVLYASGDAELLRDQVAEDEIPVLISAGSVEGLYGDDGQSPGWIFANNPLYVDQFGEFCRYVGANSEMYPAPVVGYISWPGAFGEAAFTPEAIAYCATQGVTVLEQNEVFLPTSTDITSNVQNLVDAGANILYTNTLASGPALVASTLVLLGLENDVRLAGVNWALDTSVGVLGQRTLRESDGLPAVNGMLSQMPFRWWTERDNPGIALITEVATANEVSPASRNIAYILGWSIVDIYIELYTQTVNRVGSLDAIDGVAIKETLESFVYSPLGLLDLDYTGGNRDAANSRMAMMAFANADMSGVAASGDEAGRLTLPDGTEVMVPIMVPLGEFGQTPDLRPGGADVPG